MGNTKYRKCRIGGKGFKFMKIKKLVAMLATAAMAVGLVVSVPTEAKAADELYVTGDFCGWGWGDNSGVLTSTDGNIYKGEIEVSGNSEICIKTVANWDNDADKVTYIYNEIETQQTSVTFDSAGTYELTYNKTTMQLTAEAVSTIEVNWTYDYYVAGPAELGASDWAGTVTDGPKMTLDDGKYVLTVNSAATTETVEFKIVKVGTPDVSTVDSTTEWLGDPDNGGNNYSVANSAKIKITYDATTGAVTATAVTDGGNGGNNTEAGNTTGGTDTADMAPVVMLASVAVLAAVAVVAMRKKEVNE